MQDEPELELIRTDRPRTVTLCSAGGKAINMATGECACCSD